MFCAFMAKVKAACFHSLTIAWSYIVGAASAAMIKIDDVAALLNTPDFTKQVETFIGADPKVLGKVLSVFALVTIASRMRGVLAKPKAP